MKFIANPVEVDAYVIEHVGDLNPDGGRELRLSEKTITYADAGMLARMTPKPGDYVVKQSDGYIYLNPKDVFERKYRPDAVGNRIEEIRGAVARGWCHPKNSAKEFDGDLAEAISREIDRLLAPAEPNALELGAMVPAAGLAGE